nr:phospholipase-like protein [Tanacetum cinerariifolium]
RQIELVGDGNENVTLYYHIADNIQIQFDREEFCLMTGLRFGVETNDDEPIPFRRWVFPSYLDGQHITYTMSFDRLHDDDAGSLCCLGILQLVLLGVEGKRRVPDRMLRLENDRTWILESFRVTASQYYNRDNRYPRVAAWSKKNGRFMGTMVYGFFS